MKRIYIYIYNTIINILILNIYPWLWVVFSLSEDESENSQGDEQFKAKRTFLMSGLPESLKRQIAKKAASLEAYSAANSCLRIVVHVQQKDEGAY